MKTKILLIHKYISMFLLIASMFFVATNVYAQNKAVSGSVKDENGQPIPGVNVVEKGTTQGVITDQDGRFSMNVSENSVLVFSFVGYLTQEVVVRSQTQINVIIVPDVTTLSEVVVTGYITQSKVDITGAISVVDVDKLVETPTANPMQALQGRVPGLYIETTGDPSGRNSNILIRGISTLGSNSPLYIIDGVPTTSAEAFSSLNPNSIETMQVLKDAAASSIYGSRASNGVIIVTTKEGVDKFRINFSSSLTTQNITRRLPVLNSLEYGAALWQASINDKTDPAAHSSRYSYDWHTDGNGVAVLDRVVPVEWIGGSETYGLKSADTDWQDEVFRQGLIFNNDLTISGATDRSSLLMSIGYLHNKGVLEYNEFKKISGQLNTSTSFFDKKLTIGQNLLMATTSEIPLRGDHSSPGLSGFYHTTAINMTYFMQPMLPVYYTDGFPHFSGPLGSGFTDRNNPLQVMWLGRDNRVNDLTLFGNIHAELTPVKNLHFRTSFGVDNNNDTRWSIERTWEAGFLSRSINYLEKQIGKTINWNWTNTASYNLIHNKHTVDFLLGMEAISNNYQYMRGYREEFADELFDYFQFSSGTGPANVYGETEGNKLLSYFGKINYKWAERYLASVTVRLDGSSRFGTENRFGVFPAMTLGWRINEEQFMSDIGFISNLKLRTGIGRVGNQEIGNAARFGLYAANYGTLGGLGGSRSTGTAYDIAGANTGNLPSGYVRTQLENINLKWESTDEINVGIDFGFLADRVTGSFDYFARKTEGILTEPPYVGAMGEGSSQYVNGATMQNNGFEIVLGFRGDAGKFSYNVMGNVSSFHDKVTYLPPAVVRSYAGNVEKTIIGRSVTSVFGYITDGIFKTQEEVDAHATQPGKGVGRLRYVDLNNDGKIDPLDQDWLGTTLPKFLYGVNTDLSYNNFTLSVFMQGVSGRTVNDGVKAGTDFTSGQGVNFGRRVLDAWTPQNTDATVPMLSLLNSNDETRVSNYYLVNGSYFKVRNAMVGYALPKKILDKIKLEQLRIYIMGENFILIKPKGKDAFTSPDPETPGGIYPRPVSYTLGIKVTI